jgi:osmotically-inducible protein OsmY
MKTRSLFAVLTSILLRNMHEITLTTGIPSCHHLGSIGAAKNAQCSPTKPALFRSSYRAKLTTIWASVIKVISCMFLTGCVAAVVVGAAAGIVVYDKRSLPTIESDTRIFFKIHKAILKDPRLADSRVIVSSFNRVVLLVGQTPAASLREVAEKIAHRTANVRRVYNEVTIGFPLSLRQKTKDSWITGQVRSLMLAEKDLESGSIRIVTENGVVYLMGIATHEQANIAVNVARQVKGVVKVVKIFQYIV